MRRDLPTYLFFTAAFVLSGCESVEQARPPVVPHETGFREVLSLKELPHSVQTILGADALDWRKRISDRGQPFNATDIVDSSEQLPSRRFVMGGITARDAIIVQEIGGRGYHVEVLKLALLGERAWIKKRRTLPRTPKDLDEAARILDLNRNEAWLSDSR